MAPRRTARPPAAPPATAEAGADHVRRFAVKLFHREGGEAADWGMIVETLFKAAFDVLDRLPQDRRQALAEGAYRGAYDRAPAPGPRVPTGDCAVRSVTALLSAPLQNSPKAPTENSPGELT